jgi:hypothetical protein
MRGILFDPEDEDSIFLRNVGELVPDYTALHRKYFTPQVCNFVNLAFDSV